MAGLQNKQKEGIDISNMINDVNRVLHQHLTNILTPMLHEKKSIQQILLNMPMVKQLQDEHLKAQQAIFSIQAEAKAMKLFYEDLKGDGAIINLASSSALRPDSSGYGAYAAVKEAIRSLTRAAAVEWGKDNIRVNTIMPLANSVGMQWWVDERPEEASEFIDTIPLKRIGDCENDIGESVCQLVSDGMNYITGSTIMLDGGQAYLR